jgi:octaprenyl-diphosphate synthase
MFVAVIINLDQERDRLPETALDRLTEMVNDDLVRVNEIILQHMESPVALIPQLAGHIIGGGGKRLRPLLTLASARLCGYEGRHHLGLAASVEFIHTATLLHDDVVDDSGLRRGQAAANTLWGNKASVLVGDFLFSRAFKLMVSAESIKLLDILSSASAVIAEGEILQLLTTSDPETSEAAYLDVVRAKTARLFAASCRIGAVVAERPAVEEDALESFGFNLGIAFQLVDDVLDYLAVSDTLGKAIGDDFREGKMTLPVILAYYRGSKAERQFWRRTLEEMEQGPDDLEKAVAYMKRHGTLDDTVERARHYTTLARDALAVFPQGTMKEALLGVADFCVERAY